MALIDDLTKPKNSFSDFSGITQRILRYIPDVVSQKEHVRGYTIWSSTIAGSTKFIRPIKDELFIYESEEFDLLYRETQEIFEKIKNGQRVFSDTEKNKIDQCLYTIQQALGAGFDLLSKPNSARKHVGNRFEELIRSVFSEIGVANKRTVLQITYETEQGKDTYKCENDVILSPYNKVKSDRFGIDESEIVVSIKTTSKDRMGKIFIDKILLQNFTGKRVKVIGIIHNDVQRKGPKNISFTLVPRLFLVYHKFLTPLEGIYYLDMPPVGRLNPFEEHMKQISDLLTEDVWKILKA